MAALDSVPGLGGYLDAQKRTQDRSLEDLQQANAGMGLLAGIKKQQDDQEIHQILMSSPDLTTAVDRLSKLPHGYETATHLMALDKAKKDAALTDQLMGGASQMSPDQLDVVGQKMALGGHPGAATVMNIADKRRADAAAKASLPLMQGTPQGLPTDAPVPGTNQQTTEAIPASDMAAFMKVANAGGPMTATPQTGDVSPVKQGGMFDSLTQSSSPPIAARARFLQDTINSPQFVGSAANQKYMQDEANRLTAMENANKTGADNRQARIDLRVTPPAGSDRTKDAINNEAWYQIINGRGRPGASAQGAAGEPYRAAVSNRVAEIAQELNMTPMQLATLGPENKSKFLALNALEKDLTAIGPFHDMLNTNAKIAIDLAKKIEGDRTRSQLLNKPITWLMNNAAGDPDIAEYLFQIQTVKTEGARILNNPRLVGQLSDSARHEMGDVINGNMPLAQTERVLARMMSDGDNRVNAMVNKKLQILNEVRGSAGGAPTAPATTTAPASAPASGWTITPIK